jgi:acyl-CoA synthetase (AMP-forming)/AMP-acid ligase II
VTDWIAAGWHGGPGLAAALEVGAAGERGAALFRFVSDDRPTTRTNAEMFRDAAHVASGLARIGVAPTDVVLCQLPNWAEGAVLVRACALLGVALCPVVPTATPAEVAVLALRSGAKVAVTAATWRGRDRAAHLDALTASPIEHLVIVGGDAPPGAREWDELAACEADPPPPVTNDPTQTGYLLFTSGSTGAPKGVRHSFDTVLAEALGAPLAPPVARDPARRVLHVLPPGHSADLLVAVRSAIQGTPTVVLDRWDPERALALVEEHAITATSMTPYHLQQLVDAHRGQDTSSLAGVLVGAAGVPPTLVEAADRLGWPTFRCYGSTEHPSVTASAPTDRLRVRACTDGLPLPGNRVRIVDRDLRDVEAGAEGEVLTHGPERALGYLDAADDDGTFLPGGWYRTGDVGRVGTDGRLTITDRVKDLIIRGGENIAAKEVEDALVAHPAVAEVAVVAMPDAVYGERACAFVVTRAGRSVTLDELRRRTAAAGLAGHKAPEELRVVESLPRTPAGKVRKVDLRAALREQTKREQTGTAR